MSTDTRPVWLTREQIEKLADLARKTPNAPIAMDIVNAWDRAPSNPQQTVYRDLASDDRFDENFDPALATRIALEALGMATEENE